jgi:hypothetical protein
MLTRIVIMRKIRKLKQSNDDIDIHHAKAEEPQEHSSEKNDNKRKSRREKKKEKHLSL